VFSAKAAFWNRCMCVKEEGVLVVVL